MFNTYALDALISHEAVHGTHSVAILLHPPSHTTSSFSLLGSLQLKARLLGSLGCVVLHIRHDEWNEQRTEEQRLRALRTMLRELLAPQQVEKLPGLAEPVSSASVGAAKAAEGAKAEAKSKSCVIDAATLHQAQQRQSSTQSQVAAALAQFKSQQQQQQQ